MKPITCIAALAILTSLVGCQSTYSGPEKDVVPAVNAERSALLVRVNRDGKWCVGGAMVRLTPLSNGQLQPDRSVEIRTSDMPVTTSGYSMVRNMGRSPADGEKYVSTFRQMQLASMKQSFTSLPPGDYVITYLRCTQTQNRTQVKMGNAYKLGWLPEGSGADKPVFGENFIRIPPATVVDAGTLDIRVLGQDVSLENGLRGLAGMSQKGMGMVLSVMVPAESQKKLRQEYPDAYATVKFGKFTMQGTASSR